MSVLLPNPNIDERVGTLILYLAAFCRHKKKPLSRTLLNKFFFNIDFGHFALYQAQITDFRYKKDQFGPVPIEALYYLEGLLEKGKLQLEMREHSLATKQYGSYVTDLDLSGIVLADCFEGREIDTIVKTAVAFVAKTAAMASDESHCQYVWLATPPQGYIQIEGAKFCTFEWLDYFGNENDKEGYDEAKAIREDINKNLKLRKLMKQVVSTKRDLSTTTKPLGIQ